MKIKISKNMGISQKSVLHIFFQNSLSHRSRLLLRKLGLTAYGELPVKFWSLPYANCTLCMASEKLHQVSDMLATFCQG